MAEFKFQVCFLVVLLLLPDGANEVPKNRRRNLSPKSWRDVCRGRIICLVLSLVLHAVSELRFSYLTNANPTDIQIWAEDLVHPHCISNHSILAVTWNLKLCTALLLYHLHLPRQSQTQCYNVLYVNVLSLSSTFSYLKFGRGGISLILKEKCYIYTLRYMCYQTVRKFVGRNIKFAIIFPTNKSQKCFPLYEI